MPDPNPPDIASLFEPPPEAVIETHISKVYLTADRAFKLKKAVKLPFLDFTLLSQRQAMAQRELDYNRRTAPDLYLGLRAVWRRDDGRLALDPPPGAAAIEWLLEMRRFADDATLDRRLAAGLLDGRAIDAVAEAVAALHAQAARSPRSAYCSAETTAVMNDRCFRGLDPEAVPVAEIAALDAETHATVTAQADLLRARGLAGHMRRGHGDLHLRNIAWVDDRPLLFDCLEFDDALAEIDTLYDLAFLLMDLLAQQRRDLASRLLSRYLECQPDDAGLALLPLYVSLRAAIRGHIAGLSAAEWPMARQYVALARSALVLRPPRLVAVGGLSGSGKTNLARGLAASLPGVAGAAVVRSDVTRKALFGVAARERLPEAAYSAEAGQRTYAAMLARARTLLGAGQSVVLDAVHGRAEERIAAAALAAECGVRFDAVWLEAPPADLIERVGRRKNDASDATPEVVRRQLERITPPDDWPHVATQADRSEVLGAVLKLL